MLLLAGDPDWAKATLGSQRALKKLTNQGGLSLVHQPEIDHAIMRSGTKDTVSRTLRTFVVGLLTRPAQPRNQR